MKRRHVSAWLALWATGVQAQSGRKKREPTGIADGVRGRSSDADLLVSPQEVQQFQGSAGFDDPLPLRPRGALPSIDILQPAPGEQKVKAPFAIQLRFRSSDSSIVPDSFKVLYGALRLDITDRIRKYAQPSAEGISIDKANIPPGKHRITVQVADDKQRVAEREIRIEVE